MAHARSRRDSMMRQPVTPQALQPMPMHIVSACLPQLCERRKQRSTLNASRGRKPTSSSSVNSGKKMAIGGSITATTQPVVRKAPSASSARSGSGAPRAFSSDESSPSRKVNSRMRSCEG